MEYVTNGIALAEQIARNPTVNRWLTTYRKHYKDAYLWTYKTGCLVFTSLIIYIYVLGGSSETGRTFLDGFVTFLFFLGALAYIALSSLFKKLSRMSDNSSLLEFLKITNKWVFVILSFFPGIYFAFQYDRVILRFYMIVHLVTTCYFFYKRIKEFQLVPFLIGLIMSFALGSIGPSIRFFFSIFGSGWFPTTCASTLETLIDTSMALAFMFRLPEKYLPSNMIFGLKVVKYLLFFFSWKTFFIIMVITSWKNIGTGVETFMELYFVNPKQGNDKHKTQEDKHKTQEDKDKTQEDKHKTQEDKHKTQEDKHKTREDKDKAYKAE